MWDFYCFIPAHNIALCKMAEGDTSNYEAKQLLAGEQTPGYNTQVPNPSPPDEDQTGRFLKQLEKWEILFMNSFI